MQMKMVQAWIEIHLDELFAEWEPVVANKTPIRIAPLRYGDAIWKSF